MVSQRLNYYHPQLMSIFPLEFWSGREWAAGDLNKTIVRIRTLEYGIIISCAENHLIIGVSILNWDNSSSLNRFIDQIWYDLIEKCCIAWKWVVFAQHTTFQAFKVKSSTDGPWRTLIQRSTGKLIMKDFLKSTLKMRTKMAAVPLNIQQYMKLVKIFSTFLSK